MMQHASPAPALTMMATQNVPPPPYQDSPQVSAPGKSGEVRQPWKTSCGCGTGIFPGHSLDSALACLSASGRLLESLVWCMQILEELDLTKDPAQTLTGLILLPGP
jgi:hypothetical protein